MTALTILPGDAQWRSRKVRYFQGDWASIQTMIPEFELLPFAAGSDEPANPFLRTVMRLPLSATERQIPVGVVSNSYTLAPHRTVAELCRAGLIDAGMKASELRYEVGLSELGEWMNLRITLPERFTFKDTVGHPTELRLECFNSVDGSSSLVILLAWFRLVCTNGMVIRETKIEFNERHGQGLNLASIPERIRPTLEAIAGDQARIEKWQTEGVRISDVADWANGSVSTDWGVKAAARIYHICNAGRDIDFPEPFASGKATEKPIRYIGPVPGSPAHAQTKYDVSQALSFVASGRRDPDERIAWQTAIPKLLAVLPATPAA